MKFRRDIPKWIKQNAYHKPFLLVLFYCWVNLGAQAQSLQELEQKRQRIQADINLTNDLLADATQSKAEALTRYMTLQQQIEKRKELIQTLKKEIVVTNKSILRSSHVVTALQDDIEALQLEYADIIRSVYRQKMTQSTLLFLLSASDFNEVFRRWNYIRQYDAYRQKQANLIADTQAMLIKKLDFLQNKKEQKQYLILEQASQNEMLQTELQSRNSLYQLLRKDEKRLQSELQSHIASRNKLDKAIEEIIFAATNITKKSAGASVPETNSTTSTSSIPKAITAMELARWTSDFQHQKGQLPWPVASGVITRPFGEQAHPSIPKIKINNNGIDIKTKKRAQAQAIFEGVVAGTQFIPGYQNTLIIKHGEYFTVYSNLEELFVKKGERITQGQLIGQVSTNRKDKTTEIHFEVWRQKQRLNPSDWIKK